MYKVLIVEDERNTRRGLLTLLRTSSLPLSLETAEDGQKGYERAIAWRPDMIITDIRMPLCSGLDMIRRLKDSGLHARCIILTGFAEFRYAQTALQYGVTDYILKPVVPDRLFSLLESSIQQARRDTDPGEAASVRRHILLNRKDESQLRSYCVSRKYTSGLCAVIYTERGLSIPEPLARALQSHPTLCPVILPDTRFYGIMVPFTDGTDTENISDSLHRLESLSGQYPACTVVYSTWNFSDHYPVMQDYRALCDSQKWTISLGISFFSLRDIQDITHSAAPQLPVFYRKDLKKLLLSRQYQACADHICHFLPTLQKQNIPPREIILAAVQSIYKMDMAPRPEASAELRYMDAVNRITNARTMPEILEAIRDYYDCCTTPVQETYSRLVTAAIQEIRTNYHQFITLNSTAEKLNVSPQHLSRVFSKETSKTFVNYLTDYRMEKAKYMLEHTSEKIQSIAARTGYPDAGYFCTIFKRHTGVTPNQYRSLQRK